MTTSDENSDRSLLSERDQLAWMRIRSRENLRSILELLYQTGYMAMAQAARIYGGSAANASREIRERLVTPGLAGQREIRGNGYLYLRPAGARIVTGDLAASGVPAVPEKTDRTLTIAFGRIEWVLRQKASSPYRWIPGYWAPRGFHDITAASNLPAGAVDPDEFWRAMKFRGGTYCIEIKWNTRRFTVVYLVIDVGQSRSAYRELIGRMRESAKVLYAGARTEVLVLAPGPARAGTLVRLLGALRLDPPVTLDDEDDTSDRVNIFNFGFERYTTYAFHRS